VLQRLSLRSRLLLGLIALASIGLVAGDVATYTSLHAGSEVAFIRDGIVVFAPKFTSTIDSDTLEISGDLNADQANRMVQLLRKLA